MEVTTNALSDIEETATGWKLSSCEKYWVIVSAQMMATEGWDLFLWAGDAWRDSLGAALLYDREAATVAVSNFEDSEYAVIRVVNLADFLRADRRMCGYPSRLAGKLRHAGSDEAMQDIYRAVLHTEG